MSPLDLSDGDFREHDFGPPERVAVALEMAVPREAAMLLSLFDTIPRKRPGPGEGTYSHVHFPSHGKPGEARPQIADRLL